MSKTTVLFAAALLAVSMANASPSSPPTEFYQNIVLMKTSVNDAIAPRSMTGPDVPIAWQAPQSEVINVNKSESAKTEGFLLDRPASPMVIMDDHPRAIRFNYYLFLDPFNLDAHYAMNTVDVDSGRYQQVPYHHESKRTVFGISISGMTLVNSPADRTRTVPRLLAARLLRTMRS